MTPTEVKKSSEARISQLGLTANVNLSALEPMDHFSFRNPQDIAKRIQVLAYLYVISFGVKKKQIKPYLTQYNLLDALSKDERKMLKKMFLTKQDKINVLWFAEAIEILGWTIGLWSEVKELDFCNEDRQADKVPQRKDPTDFIENAKLIDRFEIYQMADLIYRLHWNAKRKIIGNLGDNSNDVYSERHKAINWVLGTDENWDEVQADT